MSRIEGIFPSAYTTRNCASWDCRVSDIAIAPDTIAAFVALADGDVAFSDVLTPPPVELVESDGTECLHQDHR